MAARPDILRLNRATILASCSVDTENLFEAVALANPVTALPDERIEVD